MNLHHVHQAGVRITGRVEHCNIHGDEHILVRHSHRLAHSLRGHRNEHSDMTVGSRELHLYLHCAVLYCAALCSGVAPTPSLCRFAEPLPGDHITTASKTPFYADLLRNRRIALQERIPSATLHHPLLRTPYAVRYPHSLVLCFPASRPTLLDRVVAFTMAGCGVDLGASRRVSAVPLLCSL